MVRITSKDYRDILQLVSNAGFCENIECLIKVVFPSIAEMFRAECVTFQLIDRYPRWIKIIESRSFKPDKYSLNEDTHFPKLYKEDYYRQSPLLREALHSLKNVLKIGDYMSLLDWERSDFYNDFIVPQHLCWEIFLTLRRQYSLEGIITLWRNRKQPDFEDLSLSKANILAPQLKVAIHNIRLLSMINSWKAKFLSEDNAKGQGILLLDHRLRLCYSNMRGREICAQLNGRKVRKDKTTETDRGDFLIPSYITNDCISLLSLLKITEQPIVWPKERMVFAANNCRFHIECALIWKPDQLSMMCPFFMISLTDLNKENQQVNILQANFNLSKRELDILYFLVHGLTHNEIADNLFISKLTVDTHIKNIYKKLGTRSKFDLIRKVQSPIWLA